ncbi:MAG: hypothetical protein ABN482_07260 [Corticimicrobacter sp.]|uniref:hypothetical protein n=1 Tax=Corticimicrobacter sp. TaxID=2678536 RepID=UPI0032D9CDB2
MVLLLVLSGCDLKPAPENVGRTFSSIQRCLDHVAFDTGERLDITNRTPGRVWGETAGHRLPFRCEGRVTELKQLEVEGRWQRQGK